MIQDIFKLDLFNIMIGKQISEPGLIQEMNMLRIVVLFRRSSRMLLLTSSETMKPLFSFEVDGYDEGGDVDWWYRRHSIIPT